MSLVKAQCTNCKGTLEIDEKKDAAICPYCGSAFIVEKAIQQFITNNQTINHIENAVIQNGYSEEKYIDNGITQLLLEKYDNAFDTFKKMSIEYPGNWKAWYGLSLAQNGKKPEKKLSITEDNSFQLVPPHIKNLIGDAYVYNDNLLKQEYESKKKRDYAEINESKVRIVKIQNTLKEREERIDNLKKQRETKIFYLNYEFSRVKRIGFLLVFISLIIGSFFVYVYFHQKAMGYGSFWTLLPALAIACPMLGAGINRIQIGFSDVSRAKSVIEIDRNISTIEEENETLWDQIDDEKAYINETKDNMVQCQNEYEQELRREDRKTLSYYVDILKNNK